MGMEVAEMKKHGGRKAFTLIELLIVMVILAILAGIVIISIGGTIARGHANAYDADREQIEMAVADFMTRHAPTAGQPPLQEPGEAPLVEGVNLSGPDLLPGESYYTIAMCPLLTSAHPKGMLKQVPNTAEAKNCAIHPTGANNQSIIGAYDCSGECQGHYRWLCTADGDVGSVCVDIDPGDCPYTNRSGYMSGIYP
jgi:prepilin-type N-terminal cleavage/methylation domain-containing protein